VRYFYDCEFIEDGVTIDLVSIGVVAEDGREFYAVSTEFDAGRAGRWVRANVLPKLPPPSDAAWCSRARMREDLLAFLTAGAGDVELWAWVAAYDHVALCQLWGSMTALPRALPRFTRELRQRWDEAGRPALPPPTTDAHDALADARLNRRRWDAIEQAAARA
jgi:3' exoribonuclease, RNase T-like